MTDLLFLRDAYQTEFEATVVESSQAETGCAEIALDQTCFYPTGGGQPHDTGTLTIDGSNYQVSKVRKDGDLVWHTITLPEGESDLTDQPGSDDSDPAAPAAGSAVVGTVDWDRRHQLMRTHTAMHILCGVIWNEYGKAVTGGNMEPLSARMDFEFDPLPEGFGQRVQDLVNEEINKDLPIEVSFLPRSTALADEDLIRTKVNLIPEFVTEIRVVDIVGLDKQADGGTHVHSTSEVGTFEVVKTQSKGKGNKRVRIALHD